MVTKRIIKKRRERRGRRVKGEVFARVTVFIRYKMACRCQQTQLEVGACRMSFFFKISKFNKSLNLRLVSWSIIYEIQIRFDVLQRKQLLSLFKSLLWKCIANSETKNTKWIIFQNDAKCRVEIGTQFSSTHLFFVNKLAMVIFRSFESEEVSFMCILLHLWLFLQQSHSSSMMISCRM